MISAIVLAAGESSRMGSRDKRFMPYGNTTILGQVLSALAGSKANEIITVVDSGSIAKQLQADHPTICFVVNQNAQSGLTSSIRTGVLAAAAGNDFLICHGDMPFITSEEYNILINNSLDINNKYILRPFFNTKQGHPVLFSNHFREEIIELKSLDGCRPILQSSQQFVHLIEVRSDGYFTDIDTLEDYQALIK